MRVAHLPAFLVVICNDFTQFLYQGLLGQVGTGRFIMQAGVGERLETADKRSEGLNRIPIPERAVPQSALPNAFHQILQQKGMSVQEILLHLDLRKPTFVLEQLWSKA